MRHFFEKCGFSTGDYAAAMQDYVEELQILFNKISGNCSNDQ